MRIAHVGLAVRDLEGMLAFYTELVGLRLTERFAYPDAATGHGGAVAAAAFLRSDATHHCLVLFALREAGPAGSDAPATGLHHLAFELPTPVELLAKLRQLESAGVPVEQQRIGGPGNQPRFYVRDPEGNLVEFYWGIDQIGWDGRPRPYPPITEVDLEAFDFEAAQP